MDLGISGKNALVCGASRGLGRACAEALAAEGCKVALCARASAALDKAAADIATAHGVKTIAAPADLSDSSQAASATEMAINDLGGVDILINNNGGPPTGQWADFTEDNWRRAMDMNLLSAQAMTRVALPGMMHRGWGRIINITSVSVKQPLPGLMLSNSVRAAVIGWAKSLADEAAPHGVTVNNICPGWILTKRVDDILEAKAGSTDTTKDQILAGVLTNIPAGRIGKPEELGCLAAFLASEQAGYITGASYAIDGGLCRALL